MIRAHIFYIGMVQGIGFRYTALRQATALGLKGWIKNLSDGRVEAMIEGPKEKIAELNERLRGHFGGYVKDIAIEEHPPQGNQENFKIVY